MLGLRRGVWVFAIAAPGFQKVSQAGEVQIGNQNPPLNVKLVKDPTPPNRVRSPTSQGRTFKP